MEYAIDKVAIGQIYGGPGPNTPLNQVIPPGNVGYQPFNLYPTPGNRGDQAKCRQLLAQAGYPNGLTLSYVYRNAGNHPAVTQSVQADLKSCGVTVKLIPQTSADFYGKYLSSRAPPGAGCETSPRRAGSRTGTATTAARSWSRRSTAARTARTPSTTATTTARS